MTNQDSDPKASWSSAQAKNSRRNRDHGRHARRLQTHQPFTQTQNNAPHIHTTPMTAKHTCRPSALRPRPLPHPPAPQLLLDSPLAAVDSHVGEHIFFECIKGFLKGAIICLPHCSPRSLFLRSAAALLARRRRRRRHRRRCRRAGASLRSLASPAAVVCVRVCFACVRVCACVNVLPTLPRQRPSKRTECNGSARPDDRPGHQPAAPPSAD